VRKRAKTDPLKKERKKIGFIGVCGGKKKKKKITNQAKHDWMSSSKNQRRGLAKTKSLINKSGEYWFVGH